METSPTIRKPRRQSRPVRVGTALIGGGMPVAIEARLDDPADAANDGASPADGAKRAEIAGATILCRSCFDVGAARTLAEFARIAALPITADIGRCDPRVAHAAAEAGASAIWFEPSTGDDRVAMGEFAAIAHAYGCTIGVSVCEPHVENAEDSANFEQAVARYAAHSIDRMHAAGIVDFIVSLRLQSPAAMAGSARALARVGDFPIALAIGRAHASRSATANVAGALAVGLPLLMGIGDMLCLPGTSDPTADVHAAVDALRSIGLRPRGVAVTAGPDFLRQRTDADRLPPLVENRLTHISRTLDVQLSADAKPGASGPTAWIEPTTAEPAGTPRLHVAARLDIGQSADDAAERIARAVELAAIELDAPDLDGLATELCRGRQAADDEAKLWSRVAVCLRHVFRERNARMVWGHPLGAAFHARLTGRRDAWTLPPVGETLPAADPSAAAAAISTAIGLAVADAAAGRKSDIIVVVDRAAIETGAMLEALRACRESGAAVLVVAVDVAGGEPGLAAGVASQLARVVSSPPYLALREIGKQIVQRLPGPGYTLVKRIEESGRTLASGDTIFDELGLYYVGPVPTRGLGTLLSVLHNLSRSPRSTSVLVHVAGNAPLRRVSVEKSPKPLKEWFDGSVQGDAAVAIVDIGAPPALPAGLSRRAAGRYFAVGNAARHGAGLATGLSAGGHHPFVFLDRRNFWRGPGETAREIARRNLPVCFVVDLMRGYAPEAWLDAPPINLEAVPGFVVLCASDSAELSLMLAFARKIRDRPVLIGHAGLESGEGVPHEPVELAHGRIVANGGDVAVLAAGRGVAAAEAARRALGGRGVGLTIADARFTQPLDRGLVMTLFETHRQLILLDDPAMAAGFAKAAVDVLAELGPSDFRQRLHVVPMGRAAANDIVARVLRNW
ncbi:MAG: flavodoxin-dependent (E)-4-hydroxy-3-methylbut-2-enyl-diphosphate synthase [Rhodospirillales bacterium]|nr:flavodoxin-dependent (E)-4-hydroxy-3-methylbut-2-enyl-diphosphate synthase [Rhodospirillales bacterium]